MLLNPSQPVCLSVVLMVLHFPRLLSSEMKTGNERIHIRLFIVYNTPPVTVNVVNKAHARRTNFYHLGYYFPSRTNKEAILFISRNFLVVVHSGPNYLPY